MKISLWPVGTKEIYFVKEVHEDILRNKGNLQHEEDLKKSIQNQNDDNLKNTKKKYKQLKKYKQAGAKLSQAQES